MKYKEYLQNLLNESDNIKNIFYHGTDKEVTDYVLKNGFGTNKRFEYGIEPGSSMKDYTFITPSQDGAKWYANQNMRIKNPVVIKVRYDGKIYWINKRGIEKYGAMRQSVIELGQDMGHMIDIDIVKKTLMDSGYSAIGFFDKDSMNRKSVLVFDPQNIEVIKLLEK